MRGLLEYYAGRAHAAVRDLHEVTHRLRDDTSRLLRRSQVHLAQSLILIGRWDDALVSARAAIDQADEEHRLEIAQAHAAAAGVLAARGQWSAAQEHADRSAVAAQTAGIGEAVFTSHVAAVALHHARGEFAEVVTLLGPMSRSWPALPMFASEWWFALVVALQNVGDLESSAGSSTPWSGSPRTARST